MGTRSSHPTVKRGLPTYGVLTDALARVGEDAVRPPMAGVALADPGHAHGVDVGRGSGDHDDPTAHQYLRNGRIEKKTTRVHGRPTAAPPSPKYKAAAAHTRVAVRGRSGRDAPGGETLSTRTPRSHGSACRVRALLPHRSHSACSMVQRPARQTHRRAKPRCWRYCTSRRNGCRGSRHSAHPVWLVTPARPRGWDGAVTIHCGAPKPRLPPAYWAPPTTGHSPPENTTSGRCAAMNALAARKEEAASTN